MPPLLENHFIYYDGDEIVLRGQASGAEKSRATASDAIAIFETAARLATECNGGEIKLMPGRFRLKRSFSIPSHVSLVGSGIGTQLTLDDQAAETPILQIDSADGVRVEHLALDGEGRAAIGIAVDNSGHCRLSGLQVGNFRDYGICLRNNTFLSLVSGCSSFACGVANLYCENLRWHGRGGDFPPNTIHACMLSGGGNGLETSNAIVLNITSCSVYQAGKHGYHIHTMSNSILVSGCRAFQCGGNSVTVENSHEFNLNGSIVGWNRGHGVELKNVTWAALSGNEIIDNGVRHDPPMRGIQLRDGCRCIQITGNTIFNWPEQQPMDIAISEDASCYQNSIAHNAINYFLDRAVDSQGSNTLVADNVSENRAYAPKQAVAGKSLDDPPYDGSIIPIHRLWNAMGPFEKDQFSFRYPDFATSKLKAFHHNIFPNPK